MDLKNECQEALPKEFESAITHELPGDPPLDPRQGLCPWTPPGPLSGPLDPTP